MSTTDENIAVADYDEILAGSFRSWYSERRDSWSHDEQSRRLPLMLHDALASPSRVLDVGAGRGLDTEILLRHGHTVTGIDLVDLPDWKDLARSWGTKVEFVCADVAAADLPGAYDAVLDNGSFHHQHPDRYESYLGRLHGLLKPGGLLAICLFLRADDAGPGMLHTAPDGRFSREFTAEEADDTLRTNGFEPIGSAVLPRHRPQWRYLHLICRTTEG
ncbi:class I SAM-dependent methyltransferase [Haloglycomyces albus]|uniref:class I SAM-dependent methyltransferase n=1 Tax=Haloglycomyces albus TaxID=526067 RepID=UPI00046D0BBD|nr:class I SAM-dependent methyltransferase [Haloglycomyces albus]